MTLLALAESWESFWRDDGLSAYGINPLSAGVVWRLYHDHIYRPNGVEIGSPCFVGVAGLDSHVYASDIQYSTALNQHVISINFDTPPHSHRCIIHSKQISDGYCFSAPSFGCTAAAPFPTSVPDFLIRRALHHCSILPRPRGTVAIAMATLCGWSALAPCLSRRYPTMPCRSIHGQSMDRSLAHGSRSSRLPIRYNM